METTVTEQTILEAQNGGSIMNGGALPNGALKSDMPNNGGPNMLSSTMIVDGANQQQSDPNSNDNMQMNSKITSYFLFVTQFS